MSTEESASGRPESFGPASWWPALPTGAGLPPPGAAGGFFSFSCSRAPSRRARSRRPDCRSEARAERSRFFRNRRPHGELLGLALCFRGSRARRARLAVCTRLSFAAHARTTCADSTSTSNRAPCSSSAVRPGGKIFARVRYAVRRRPAPLRRELQRIRTAALERLARPPLDALEWRCRRRSRSIAAVRLKTSRSDGRDPDRSSPSPQATLGACSARSDCPHCGGEGARASPARSAADAVQAAAARSARGRQLSMPVASQEEFLDAARRADRPGATGCLLLDGEVRATWSDGRAKPWPTAPEPTLYVVANRTTTRGGDRARLVEAIEAGRLERGAGATRVVNDGRARRPVARAALRRLRRGIPQAVARPVLVQQSNRRVRNVPRVQARESASIGTRCSIAARASSRAGCGRGRARPRRTSASC